MKKDIILFITAMNEELIPFVDALKEKKIKYTKVDNIYKFNLNEKTCYASTIGITFFNVAKLTKLINKIKPTEIILFGTQAGLNKQKIGDVIVSNNVICSDLDLVNFGYIDGTIDKKKTKAYGPLMCSGSHFMSTKLDKENLKKRFKGVSTFDMETYMIYRVCLEYDVPFMSMKGISDNGEHHPNDSFEKNLYKAALASSKYAINFIIKKSIKSLL